MGLNWKFTVIGGAENGLDASLSGDMPIIVGRSHVAALHISEPDVSGKHLEFTYAEDVCQVRNLSRYVSRLNGRDLNSGEVSPVAAGDTVEIGSHVKIRIDEVPVVAPVEMESATSWMEGGLADAPTAVLEESTVTSQGGGAPSADRTAPATSATRPVDDPTLETRAVNLRTETDAEDTTVVSGEVPSAGGESDTQTEGAGEEGETRELETRIGSLEELLERRKELERKTKFHKAAVVSGLALIALFLGALWFISRTDAETYSMEYPKVNGEPDAASFVLRDENGHALVEVDYPRNPKASVTISPSSNGITVVSYMGRDRDVPFYLQLEAVRRSEELKIGLMESVRAWIRRAEESASGFVFDARTKDELKFRFFEDVFSGCCEVESLHGLKFVTFEYTRTWADGTPWHGVLIYFRHGDTAYVHRREIPEEYWVRGANRIRKDPNIAIYANLIESCWESPGVADLPLDTPVSALIARIRNILSKERASDWRFLKKDLDAVLVKSWREDPAVRKIGEECLRNFRDVLKTYYYGKFNAFQNAKDNRDTKRMNKVRRDCAMVFDDRNERYYFLIGNSEVW